MREQSFSYFVDFIGGMVAFTVVSVKIGYATPHGGSNHFNFTVAPGKNIISNRNDII